MATTSNSTVENKKPINGHETVEGLLAKKESERKNEGASAVLESAQGVQSEVADVLGGVDGAPNEKISEKKGESGEKGDIRASSSQQAQKAAQQIQVEMKPFVIPNEEKMIQLVRAAIQEEINHEIKRAEALRKKLSEGSAQEYSAVIARIRRLNDLLALLVTAAFEAVKGLYFRYFTPHGKRKPIEDVR